MCGLDNMLPAAINPTLYLHHVYADHTTHCKHCAGDQTASMTFNPDLAPPLGTMSPVTNKVSDDNDNNNSLLPDLKAVFQGLLDGLNPRADPEDTCGLLEYLLAHLFPDESGTWNTVATV